MKHERYTIHEEQVWEIEKIKGSRFIGVAAPLTSINAMQEKVDELWSSHPEARHICWAFRGSERNVIRLVDDGEPSGTAARPIFTVIEGLGLENIGVAVIRYFGGTKLGTGGLARAYSSAAQSVLAAAERVTLRPKCSLRFEVDYRFESSLMYLLQQKQAKLTETTYIDKVIVTAHLFDEFVDQLLEEVTERTSGRALIERGPVFWS